MITFAESHVDLMGNITFTPQQLMRRWDQELLKKWRREVQDNLRDFMQIKPSLDPETFPNYAENDSLLADFIADKQSLYSRRVADEAKNVLLTQALSYERAVRDFTELQTLIDGVAGVPGIPGVIDPDTGEVTPSVPSVPAIPPLAATVVIDGQTVDNPDYIAAMAALTDLQALVGAVSSDPAHPLRALIILRGNM